MVASAEANSTAIERALALVSPTRRSVVFPHGIYFVARPVQIPDQTLGGTAGRSDSPLFLYGNGSTLIAARAMSQVMATARLVQQVPYAQAPFHLYDFILDGNQLADEVLAACTYNSVFHTCYFQHARWSGVRLTRRVGGQFITSGTAGYFDSCHIRNNGGIGLYIDSGWITDWQLRGSHVYLNRGGCIWADEAAGAQIVNSHIWNDETCGDATLVTLKNSWAATLCNNIFESNVRQSGGGQPTATSLFLTGGGTRATVTGNVFYFQVILRPDPGSHRLVFSANTVLNNGTLQAFAGQIVSTGNSYEQAMPFYRAGGSITSFGDLCG